MKATICSSNFFAKALVTLDGISTRSA